MSKSSVKDQNEPYYRKFGKPAWYRKQPKFPEGRDPYHDLFSDDKVAEIIRKIDPKLKPDANALQADLRDLAHDYLTAALTAPFGIGDGPKSLTRDQRKRFFEPQVINPAKKLLNALTDENAHEFFEWPEDKIGPDPNKATLVRELARLLYRVECVLEGIVERQGDGSDVQTEFKLDLEKALSIVFRKHYPMLSALPTEYDRTKSPKSDYFKFARLCTREIFGDDLVLTIELVNSAVKPKRK